MWLLVTVHATHEGLASGDANSSRGAVSLGNCMRLLESFSQAKPIDISDDLINVYWRAPTLGFLIPTSVYRHGPSPSIQAGQGPCRS